MGRTHRFAGSDASVGLRAALGAALVSCAAAAGFAGVSALQAPPDVRLAVIAGDDRMTLVCEPDTARLEFRLGALEPDRPATYALRINHELFAARADWTGEAHADEEGAQRLIAAFLDSYLYRLRADFGAERIDLSAEQVDALNGRLSDAAADCLALAPRLQPGSAGRESPIMTAGVDPQRARAAAPAPSPVILPETTLAPPSADIQQLAPPRLPPDIPTTPLAALRRDAPEEALRRAPVSSSAQPAASTPANTATAAASTTTSAARANPQAQAAWAVQVGAFGAEAAARARLDTLAAAAGRFPVPPVETRVDADTGGAQTLYRARYTFFTRDAADAACDLLQSVDVDCFTGATPGSEPRRAAPDAQAPRQQPQAAAPESAASAPAPVIAAEATSPAAQIGAFNSEAEARAAFERLAEISAGFDPARFSERIMVVDTETARFYRARYVFTGADEARAACEAFRAAGQDCFVAP